MRQVRTPAEAAAAAERRRQIAPGGQAGVDEALIERQVRTFYGRVREHAVLGPVFAAHVEDWEEHLAKLCDFWSSVLLMTARFKGSPMAAHARAGEIEMAHFPLWLDLWRTTARDVCPPQAAQLFIARAEMIGRSLQMGLAMHRERSAPDAGAVSG
ncbi:group III truncated hemoglobin [Phenylobacterium sp.]|uniref:group III truncated hemoglobin n=1 Tax=Phenylobacterium sp. TaxID=1871053 RepID=UPI002FD8B214